MLVLKNIYIYINLRLAIMMNDVAYEQSMLFWLLILLKLLKYRHIFSQNKLTDKRLLMHLALRLPFDGTT